MLRYPMSCARVRCADNIKRHIHSLRCAVRVCVCVCVGVCGYLVAIQGFQELLPVRLSSLQLVQVRSHEHNGTVMVLSADL
jgi:hypothetical protein